MMREKNKRPASGKTTYHRDGSITLWDCLVQQWARRYVHSDAVLATIPEHDRKRIRAARKIR